MSVVISQEDTGPCRKQLVIEVPAPAVDAERRRVVEDFGRQASLPGFRKGKVPRKVVERRFKKDIDSTVLDHLLPRYWRQAQAESGIDPLLPPEVEKVEYEEGEPLRFHAVVEVRPEITLGDLDSLSLPDPEVEPSEEETAEALEDLQRRYGDWVPVERAAARGDLVNVEIVSESLAPKGGEEGETAEEEEEPQTVAIEVGDSRVWEELSLAVTGLAAGQKGEFVRRMGGDGEEGTERRFKVQVVAVKERELPPLDDELAKTVGPFETIEDLREEIRNRIRHGKEMARNREREASLMSQLRSQHPMDLPEGVVQRELEEMLSRHAEQLARQGVDLDRAEIDWAALMDQARPQAQERVHGRLLLDAIVKARSIEVSEEEFESALADIARAQQTSTLAVRQALDRSDRLKELKAQLNREKAVKRLLGVGDEAEVGENA
ncbi:MAG: trigger factor [Acidobacteria bacterium]|nr:trigger factor [Acidobacteriota bacterium]